MAPIKTAERFHKMRALHDCYEIADEDKNVNYNRWNQMWLFARQLEYKEPDIFNVMFRDTVRMFKNWAIVMD
jgi:hypothetical protein